MNRKHVPALLLIPASLALCFSAFLNTNKNDEIALATNSADFDIEKLTYSVEGDLAATVSWTLNEAPIAAPTANLLVAGTYAMTVSVAATATTNVNTLWLLFVIK